MPDITMGEQSLASSTPTTSVASAILAWAIPLAAVPLCALLLRKVAKRLVFFLAKDEQLIVLKLTDKEVRNGPGVHIISPLESAVQRNAELLEPLDYLRVKDGLTGEVRVERGPQLLFLGPYDEVQLRSKALSLTPVEYCIVLDKRTGEKRIERGPNVFVPGAYEDCSDVLTALSLTKSQYVKLHDSASGRRWVERGPALLVLEPTWAVDGGVQSAISLNSTQYVRLIDKASGAIRVERGEQMVFPSATESILNDEGVSTVINLKVFQYVKILDNATGNIRVVKGEATVILGPTEQALGKGKVDAVEIDTETAVAVRSKRTGELTLVSAATEGAKSALFFPQPEENIVEVQKLIKLADYEAMIIVNATGQMTFYYGDDTKRGEQPRAFFVPPHHSIHTLTWSRGRRREKRDLRIERLDCRPQFMSFEFNTRTSDNVELVLEGTFFWSIVNVEQMVKMTGDTTGDICNHARSKFIQLVSQVTLKEFMDGFNSLAKKAHEGDDAFYSTRGVAIHTLEVTAYRCQDASTARILEQIIQETTNRMNRLSQQESENEIKMFAMTGEIEQETRRAELLKVLQTHKLMEAKNDGEAEAERVTAFMNATEGAVPALDARIGLWNVLRKQDALSAVSSGPARLYFTPNDVNLSIETREDSML